MVIVDELCFKFIPEAVAIPGHLSIKLMKGGIDAFSESFVLLVEGGGGVGFEVDHLISIFHS